jgi:DNA mismatch endonuclease, patch repair protein
VTDIVSEERRSYIMSRVSSKNTKPELLVRSYLHGLGLRFRIHGKRLPGRPDIIFPKYKVVIFVHGCFWHRHTGCRRSTMPATRVDFWQRKFARNIERDLVSQAALKDLGWRVIVLWECEISTIEVRNERLPRLALEITESQSSSK